MNSSKGVFFFFKLYVSKCLCLHVPRVLGAGMYRSWKKELDLLELALEAVVKCQMWVLGTELRSFDER